ncbi:MAG TPA: hypothetical protein DIT75_04645 [Rikenellaceae bacterium]|nr:hypothetical protein [Rikenellaceae bacterium]
MNMPSSKNGSVSDKGRKKAVKPTSPKKRKYRRKKKPGEVNLGAWTAVGCAVAVLIALVMIFHKCGEALDYETGAKVPQGEWRYGIDISHHNADGIVWDSIYVLIDKRGRTIRDHHLAKDIRPVSFVFIKATEGESMVDKDFKRNWRDAGMSGLRRGAYHFFRSSKDGKAQADLFIKTVGDLRFKDLPPVLDIETIHRGGSRKRLNEEALKWLNTIERHYGKKPIVYAGASFAKDYLSKEITDNYPLWIAHYEKEKPAFEGWTWWQFTDRAVVKGVPGLVDLSVIRR